MNLDSQWGVPTVSMHTRSFGWVVKLVAKQKGMPHHRMVYVPQPVMGQSPATLREYVAGLDPLTGQPVMEEIIDGLTRPLNTDEKQKVTWTRSTPRLVEAASEDEMHQLFIESHWTDYLPIVLPTEERVAAMLKGTSHKPDEVVGRMRPTNHREFWEYTVEKVAVNAVMAGARPGYFPVILALAASGATARPSTTSSAAAMAVVNGPIRHEIGMNWGTGAMGPYNHANATIGRAYGLLSTNLQGGSHPGETYMGSQGNNYAYNSLTFAENEERSPWEPFHVEHGFRLQDSVVSVFGGCRTTAFTLGVREKTWEEQVRDMLRGINPYIAPTYVLDPITARLFIDRGLQTKQDLINWTLKNAKVRAGVYWDHQLVANYIRPRADMGEEPYATLLKAAEDELIVPYRPKDVKVLITGGETNGYWRIIGAPYHRSVSIDEWR